MVSIRLSAKGRPAEPGLAPSDHEHRPAFVPGLPPTGSHLGPALTHPEVPTRRQGNDREQPDSERGAHPGRIPIRIPQRYTRGRMATEQIAVRLPGDLLAELDDLVRRGVYASRAAAVRAGIETVMELDRRRQTDRAVIDGYRRTPPTRAEHEAAIASLRDAIAEEPW